MCFSRRAHIAHSHSVAHSHHIERHVGASSDYLKALVFGGLDGIVTIFAIVAGCVGAHLSPMQTVIVGCGNLLADAVSMGFGEVREFFQMQVDDVDNYHG